MMLGMTRTISMAVEDLYDATAFIVDKADEWGIDSSQIVACGSSAGAITVLHGEYALCNASPLVQHLPAGFRYAGIVSFAGAIFEMGEELRWASQPAPMMLFHGDADANVPYNVIRESGVGFFGSKYIAGQLRAMNSRIISIRSRTPHTSSPRRRWTATGMRSMLSSRNSSWIRNR